MVSFLLVTASYAIVYMPVAILIEYWSAVVAIPLTAVACMLLGFALRRGTSSVVVFSLVNEGDQVTEDRMTVEVR